VAPPGGNEPAGPVPARQAGRPAVGPTLEVGAGAGTVPEADNEGDESVDYRYVSFEIDGGVARTITSTAGRRTARAAA